MKMLPQSWKRALPVLLFGLGLALLPTPQGAGPGRGLLALSAVWGLGLAVTRRRDRRRPLVSFSRLSPARELAEDGFCLRTLPPGLVCAEPGLWQVEEAVCRDPARAPRPLLAVVDDFCHRDRYIGARRLLCHGELVTRLALAGWEDKGAVLACDLAQGDRRHSLRGLVHALEFLARLKAQGLPLDGVVLSLGLYCSYGTLSRLADSPEPVTPGNIEKYEERLRQALTGAARSYLRQAGRAVAGAEALVRAGVPVFVAAGNSRDKQFQLLALARGAHVVGGLDRQGRPWAKGNTALVTDWAPAELLFAPQYGRDGSYLGLSCGRVSFSRAELGPLSLRAACSRRGGRRQGTSLAAPACLNQFLGTSD